MNPIYKTALGLLLVLVLSIAWWLAGQGEPSGLTASRDPVAPRDRGPVEPAFCGPLQPPRPAPPMDSPFGMHLYANTPRGIVTALPVMAIASQLPAPAGNDKTSPKEGQNETAYDDVQTVTTLLEEYLRAFGAMPMGELNDEIVRRLQGENPKGIAVLPKGHPNINAEGELVDRWGTPYRFHPESAWHMTVRSAGPDKKMWTSDDQISQDETQAVGVEL